jgi:hypothetical protein
MYTRPDGGISIITFASKEMIERSMGPLTFEEYRDHVISRSIPADAINVREIADDVIPTDRSLRNAWVDLPTDNGINIDCDKAKEVVLNSVRMWRDAELLKTDAEFIRALSKGEDVSFIQAKKEYLRNITNELKAYDMRNKIDCTDSIALLNQYVEALKDGSLLTGNLLTAE